VGRARNPAHLLPDFAVVTALQFVAVFGAGFVAGAMNSVIGAGTLLSFPALLALGIPPVVANATNAVGLVTGSVAGAYGYRHQLGPLRPLIQRALVPAAAGGAAGALLLLALPAATFDAVVPILLLSAAALVALQPRVTLWLTKRAASAGADDAAGADSGSDNATIAQASEAARAATIGRAAKAGPLLLALVFCVAVYGGYFGAAMGVLLLALFSGKLGGVQASNGVKNVLAVAVNLCAAVVFAFSSQVDWAIVPVLAVSTALGGLIGSRYGRNLPDTWLRLAVVVLAVSVAVARLVH